MLLGFMKNENSAFNSVFKQFTDLHGNPTSVVSQNFCETKKIKMSSKDPLAIVWLFAHLSRLSGFSQTGTWDRNFSRVCIIII